MKLVSYVSHQLDGAHVGAEEAGELPQGTGLRRSADCDAHMKAGDEATARLLLFTKRLEACYERRHFGNAQQPRHRAWGGHVKGSCGSDRKIDQQPFLIAITSSLAPGFFY